MILKGGKGGVKYKRVISNGLGIRKRSENTVYVKIQINSKTSFLPDNTRFIDDLLNKPTILSDDLPDKVPGNLVSILGVLQHQPGLIHTLLRLTDNLNHGDVRKA